MTQLYLILRSGRRLAEGDGQRNVADAVVIGTETRSFRSGW